MLLFFVFARIHQSFTPTSFWLWKGSGLGLRLEVRSNGQSEVRRSGISGWILKNRKKLGSVRLLSWCSQAYPHHSHLFLLNIFFFDCVSVYCLVFSWQKHFHFFVLFLIISASPSVPVDVLLSWNALLGFYFCQRCFFPPYSVWCVGFWFASHEYCCVQESPLPSSALTARHDSASHLQMFSSSWLCVFHRFF